MYLQNLHLVESLLQNKVKNVVYYRNLKLYLQLGLVVAKVHRVLTINQLTPFISISFLKDFFTSMNNSVFGKTQENLRNHIHVELITDARILRKRVAKPSFYRGTPPPPSPRH